MSTPKVKKTTSAAKSKPRNAFYAQSGGVTAVINVSAAAVIETARKHKDKIGKLYAGKNGILGALNEELIDTSKESAAAIARLRHTPGGAFGSCRHKLAAPEKSMADYERIVEVFAAHDIGYFFYNGGNDSMDTANKLAIASAKLGYPIACIGIPKTIDNDLPLMDCSPGFGSAAKYVATSIREASYDVASMSATSTQVFVLEVMGRHAGWLTAACGLAHEEKGDGPQILLFPEIPLNEKTFLTRVEQTIKRDGFCSIAVSEGIKDQAGNFLAESGLMDAFGHKQLGGVAPIIAQMIKRELKVKYHWAVSDYLQRSARHIASQTDVEHAYAVGRAAVEMAVKGANAVMPIIVRKSSKPYRWGVDIAKLSDIANKEKKLPKNFITKDGYHITAAAREYLTPLITGIDVPSFKSGLPHYVKLKNVLVKKKCAARQ